MYHYLLWMATLYFCMAVCFLWVGYWDEDEEEGKVQRRALLATSADVEAGSARRTRVAGSASSQSAAAVRAAVRNAEWPSERLMIRERGLQYGVELLLRSHPTCLLFTAYMVVFVYSLYAAAVLHATGNAPCRAQNPAFFGIAELNVLAGFLTPLLAVSSSAMFGMR